MRKAAAFGHPSFRSAAFRSSAPHKVAGKVLSAWTGDFAQPAEHCRFAKSRKAALPARPTLCWPIGRSGLARARDRADYLNCFSLNLENSSKNPTDIASAEKKGLSKTKGKCLCCPIVVVMETIQKRSASNFSLR
jgi:hypothetical protein